MATLRIVITALVHGDGAVLLRLRDEQSVTRPNRWSLPGGAVEAGEEPEQAAKRLIAEQTGLVVQDDLVDLWHGYLPGVPAEVIFFAVRTAAPGAVSNPPGFISEFVAGADIMSGVRSFTPATGYVLIMFADSARYQALLAQPDADELA
jgi:8-oxo-dGTP pyrophosphatase MutT (NUDIX family)